MEQTGAEISKKTKKKKYIIYFFLCILLVLSTWMYFRYWYVYSEGTRVGVLYKFSKKGSLFKTYEGEMILPGYSRNGNTASTGKFSFSVTDENLAKQLMSNQGLELELHYAQFNHGLVWRGDTYEGQEGQYIVDQLIKVKGTGGNQYGF